MKKIVNLTAHSGLTGPLDPTVERAHLLAKWEEDELTTVVPMAPLGDDWFLTDDPAPSPHTRRGR
jgi:hypothetical protein